MMATLSSYAPRALACLATGCATLALAACSSTTMNERGAVVPQAAYQPAEAADAYAQTRWELARWTRVGGIQRPVPHASNGQQPLTAVFTHEAGRRIVQGFAGCNSYMSTYTVANGLILLTAPPATVSQRACPDAASAALEHDFLQGMGNFTASSVDDYNMPRRLTLVLATGDILEFGRRVDPIAGQIGPKKVVYVNAQRVSCTAQDASHAVRASAAGSGAGAARSEGCLQVRDDPAQPWQNLSGEIVGFSFQPGVMYRLRVVESPDPTLSGGTSTRWVLDDVIERVAVGYDAP